jgi:peroxiredoxin
MGSFQIHNLRKEPFSYKGNFKNLQGKALLIFFFCLIAFGLSFNSYAQSAPARSIPDFTFYKMNGEPFSKKDLVKSKRIVIVFFDVTCDHCQNELKAMADRIDEFKKAEFYLVSMDNVPGIQMFMKKYAPKMNGRANVTLLTDLHKQFITRFMPVQYPATFVYGTDWKLIKYFGQNSKMRDIVNTVNR